MKSSRGAAFSFYLSTESGSHTFALFSRSDLPFSHTHPFLKTHSLFFSFLTLPFRLFVFQSELSANRGIFHSESNYVHFTKNVSLFSNSTFIKTSEARCKDCPLGFSVPASL